MISSNDLKPGLTILVDGEIYTVLEASQNKTARSAMVVKAKVRNIRTGSNVELSWGGGEKVEPAQIEKREMQYLYDDGESLVFMDNTTFDQIEISKANLQWELQFLKPNDNVIITMYDGNEILGLILPDKVTLQVVAVVHNIQFNQVSFNLILVVLVAVPIYLTLVQGVVDIAQGVFDKYKSFQISAVAIV